MSKAAFLDFVIEIVRRVEHEPGFKVLASLQVVEIRDGRRRAAATATSLAQARRRTAGEAVIGVLG